MAAADKRVPIKQSRMLADELRKAGKPYEYFEEKLGDHHFSRAEDRLDFLKQAEGVPRQVQSSLRRTGVASFPFDPVRG